MEGTSENYKEIIDRLISFPLKSQIKVDFELDTKTFRLSVPIFQGHYEVPHSVRDYVEARKHCRFKPHETSFQMEGERCVKLVQELPFESGFQPGLREQIVAFWKLAKHCHRILIELAVEEKYDNAIHFDKDLEI